MTWHILGAGSLGSRLQHRRTAGRVNIQDIDAQRRRGANRARYRVGDIVEFQIQKDRQVEAGKSPHTIRAMRGEELQSQFDPANMRLQARRQGTRIFNIGRIDGDEDGVHAFELPPFKRSRNSLPVRKKGARFSPTETGSPVRGLRPIRDGRTFTEKAPKPRNSTR